MPKVDFEPIGDRVIVEAWEEEDIQTKSGIFISVRDEANKELPQFGEVVALGAGGTFPDCPNPMNVFSLGDFVYFNRYAGEEIVIGRSMNKKENKKYTVLRLDAIFGRLSKEVADEMRADREKMRALAENLSKTDDQTEKPAEKFDRQEFGKILLSERDRDAK